MIATYAKAGTTWLQQIVAQLMFKGDPDLEVAEMSPWMSASGTVSTRLCAARKRARAALRAHRSLGTGGRPTWTRDDLHAR